MRDVNQLVAARMALASASECSVCIGAPLAMTEATLVLAEMARRYRSALANDRPVLVVGIVTPSRDGASSSALTHVGALRSELKEMLAEEDMMIALCDNGRVWVARLRDD
jgi:hypothetical protein